MAKSKDSKSSEFYLGQIRDLKKQVKSLQARLKQLERQEHKYNDQQDLIDEIIPELPMGNQQKLPCVSCGKGVLEEFEIMGRVYGTCNICGDRIKLK
jgi:hypothetical protein